MPAFYTVFIIAIIFFSMALGLSGFRYCLEVSRQASGPEAPRVESSGLKEPESEVLVIYVS